MSRTLQPEDHISRDRIGGPLGVGGMGEVDIAQDQGRDAQDTPIDAAAAGS